jgi:hypothetical protein
MALCAYFETSNALQDWPEDEVERFKLRYFLIRGRKRSRELTKWIAASFSFSSNGLQVPFEEGVFEPYLAKFAFSAYKYRSITPIGNGKKGTRNAQEVLQILTRSLSDYSRVLILFNLYVGDPPLSEGKGLFELWNCSLFNAMADRIISAPPLHFCMEGHVLQSYIDLGTLQIQSQSVNHTLTMTGFNAIL